MYYLYIIINIFGLLQYKYGPSSDYVFMSGEHDWNTNFKLGTSYSIDMTYACFIMVIRWYYSNSNGDTLLLDFLKSVIIQIHTQNNIYGMYHSINKKILFWSNWNAFDFIKGSIIKINAANANCYGLSLLLFK